MSRKLADADGSASSGSPSLSPNTHTRSAYAMTWSRALRFVAPTVGLVVVLGVLIAVTLGAGCASKKGDYTDAGGTANLAATDAPRPATLDVGPPQPRAFRPATATPAQPPAAPPPTQAA